MNERTICQSSQDSKEEGDFSLLEMLQIIVCRKRMIITCCSVAFILSVCISLALPNVYTATARVLPPQKEFGGGMAMASALISQLGNLGSLASGLGMGSNTTELYLGVLKSRSVSDAVIQRMGLQKLLKKKDIEKTRKALAKLTEFKATKEGIITITVDFKDPKQAAMLANTFVEELGRRTVELNLSKASVERVFLEKRLAVAQQELKTAEEGMKDFQEKNKTIRADAQVVASIQSIAMIKAQIVSYEAQLASLRNTMTDESPEVQKMQASIGRLRGQLAALSGVGGDNAIPSLGNAPGLGVEYVRRYRQLKIQEAVVEQLVKQLEVAKFNEARDNSSLQVLDEAVAPLRHSKPKEALIIVFSTITAFLVSIFIAFAQECLAKLPPKDAETLRNIKGSLSLPVIRPFRGNK